MFLKIWKERTYSDGSFRTSHGAIVGVGVIEIFKEVILLLHLQHDLQDIPDSD